MEEDGYSVQSSVPDVSCVDVFLTAFVKIEDKNVQASNGLKDEFPSFAAVIAKGKQFRSILKNHT